MTESSVLGIDLGTSNTVVAAFRDGAPRTLADKDGHVLIPSVVSMLPGGTVLVGRPAKERRFVDPPNTVVAAKRLVGRTWDDPALQSARKKLPYELRQGKNQSVRVMLQNELYALPEVSAFVLRKARAVAEEALGRLADRAVITVPANFNDLQREATKLAGQLAGLDVVQVLNEPTAAAIAYGYGKEATERVAVFDFGGGTFDLTLLTLHEDVFRVRATGGDMFLGGEDIDRAIAHAIADEIRARHYFDPRTSPAAFDRVREGAERVKILLSDRDSAEVRIESILQGFGGQGIDFTFAMTRAQLDAVAAPIVARTIAVCEETFRRARLDPRRFDKVVLVGGSTRMRLVRERVAELFGRDPDTSVNPDEAVALGAAIQGLAMKDAPRRPLPSVVDLEAFEARRAASRPPPPARASAPPRAPERAAATSRWVIVALLAIALLAGLTGLAILAARSRAASASAPPASGR